MKFFSNFFKDHQGRIVIAQWPNSSLWIAIVCFLLTQLSVQILSDIGFWGLIISLLYWSYLEMTSGVNTWRRLLGLVVTLSQFITLLKILIPNLPLIG
jgi:hypothetical protein